MHRPQQVIILTCHIQKRCRFVLIYDIDRDRQSPYDHGQIKKDDNLNFEMFQWERSLAYPPHLIVLVLF